MKKLQYNSPVILTFFLLSPIENWTVALDIKIIFRTVFGGKMVNDEKLQ